MFCGLPDFGELCDPDAGNNNDYVPEQANVPEPSMVSDGVDSARRQFAEDMRKRAEAKKLAKDMAMYRGDMSMSHLHLHLDAQETSETMHVPKKSAYDKIKSKLQKREVGETKEAPDLGKDTVVDVSDQIRFLLDKKWSARGLEPPAPHGSVSSMSESVNTPYRYSPSKPPPSPQENTKYSDLLGNFSEEDAVQRVDLLSASAKKSASSSSSSSSSLKFQPTKEAHVAGTSKSGEIVTSGLHRSNEVPGATYNGIIVGDRRHGDGTWVEPSGLSYTGSWVADEYHGKGRIDYPNGDEYEGSFIRNTKEGHGCYKWTDGSRYEGNYHGGLRHGRGVMFYANGHRFEGRFVKDTKHGDGVLIEGSRVTRGVWSGDALVRIKRGPSCCS